MADDKCSVCGGPGGPGMCGKCQKIADQIAREREKEKKK